MLRKTSAVILGLLLSSAAYALDSANFNKSLNEYADALAQTTYNAAENQKTGSYDAYNEAMERADKAAGTLGMIISQINSEKEIAEAGELVESFAGKSELNNQTANSVKKMLQSRANFIAVSSENAATETTTTAVSRNAAQAAVPADKLMKKHQKRLITIETPVAEAVISLDDTSKNRRVDNLEKIFKRHGCKVISSYKNEGKKGDRYCYYFSGRKYVIDTLLSHFDGSVVNADLRATVKITTGGFWGGKKKQTFTVAPKRSDKATLGELSWYKSVIQHDPIKYFSETSYDQLSQLASKEDVAGAKKLRFKNAKVEIWVSTYDKDETEAIYHDELELGDVYIDAK